MYGVCEGLTGEMAKHQIRDRVHATEAQRSSNVARAYARAYAGPRRAGRMARIALAAVLVTGLAAACQRAGASEAPSGGNGQSTSQSRSLDPNGSLNPGR